MSTEAIITGVGTLKRITAPFHEAMQTFNTAGITDIVSFKNLANARIQAGKFSLLFKADSFTREAVIYAGDNTTYFVRTSPFLDAKLAQSVAHVNRYLEDLNDHGDPIHHGGAGEIFFGEHLDMSIFNTIVSQAHEDESKPVSERKVFMHTGTEVFTIPTIKFSQYDLTLWLYGKETAQAYGEFLHAQRKFTAMVWLVDWLDPNPSRKPFIRQLVMNGSNGDINGGRRFGWDDGHMGGTWGIVP